ncbi:MAG: biotin--[acetyl-CoA-carboxylase] ligase [Candidatus Omnitrophica bacterium]|nr:biotin--[acetyl-CoA-carboxylase] ligase [Candidatus Omnitrophota bacterium]
MQKRIIEFLKKRQEYVSGEEISKQLGISRQGLWKHIHELKSIGYDIIAVPHRGYRLLSCPDRLFPSEVSYQLKTKFLGKKIYYFDNLPSTMDIAFEVGIKGAPEGTLVLAEVQTKGRGRLGRNWFSPKYKGIYLSLLLRPKILTNQTPVFTLLSAVSVCEAVKEQIGLDIQIKWPNDLLIDNKKLGGILTELNAEMDEVHFLVIGIGLNVNNERKSLLEYATSLKEEKHEQINRIELLKEILRKIEENYLIFQKFGAYPILEKWRDYNITLGRRVKILSHKGGLEIEGEAVDIDIDGGILVRNDLGLIQKVTAGDVVHCR